MSFITSCELLLFTKVKDLGHFWLGFIRMTAHLVNFDRL